MKGRERMRLKTAAERRSGTCVVADCEAKQDSFGFCVEHRKTLAAAPASGRCSAEVVLGAQGP